jgi:tRNA dimethylallyltransferase
MPMQTQIPLIIVAGPTASGKTSLAIKLAQKIDAELINVDSRQVYKYMNIGTNKGVIAPSDKYLQTSDKLLQAHFMENTNIVGWLFDVVDPQEEFNLALFQKYLEKIVIDICNRNKKIILVGGTGLYIDAIVKNYNLQTQSNNSLRDELDKLNLEKLQKYLKDIDINTYNNLNNSDVNNPRRLVRAIEKFYNSNNNQKIINQNKYNTIIIYPEYNRHDLYNKIDNRVEQMFAEGLIYEVNDLIAKGYQQSVPMQGIGYKEVQEYLQKNNDIIYTKSKIKQKHRNYARRQITWFEGKGRNYTLHKFNFVVEIDKIINLIEKFYAK